MIMADHTDAMDQDRDQDQRAIQEVEAKEEINGTETNQDIIAVAEADQDPEKEYHGKITEERRAIEETRNIKIHRIETGTEKEGNIRKIGKEYQTKTKKREDTAPMNHIVKNVEIDMGEI